MRKIVFRPAAVRDLDEVYDYTRTNWGVDQARLYIEVIRASCDRLAKGQLRGRAESVPDGYLKLGSGRHSIYYREEPDRLVVVRILHQCMDPGRHLD